ncbi:protein RIC-3 isoform X4 [Cricetulus griseus]|uniref:Protein RIC-3 isoform X4 n=1 Tax=Cricetulus griseus TaxID=10029 RepID=A0A9J7GUB2_CRIGR|nr:protein RIC-3 isoform X4 [Cricetulus griseus]
MAYSTVQKVALASGLVLAVSLLLPKAFLSRGKRPEPPPGPEGKLGRFPPMMHHHSAPSDGQMPHFQRSHLAEAFAKAKGAGGGAGGGGSGRGLMGQIIPIYGFGIFLYILYILFKLSKGKTAEDRNCSTAPPGNTHRKISYPEETYPVYDLSDGITHRQETILVDYPDPKEPSAEEIAERMGAMEEEGSEHLNWDHLPTDSGAQKDNSVTLCDPNPESCSCCFHEEEDPAVLAENAGFSADGYSEQEEATKEDWPQDFTNEGLGVSTDNTHMGGLLRKRTPQSLE